VEYVDFQVLCLKAGRKRMATYEGELLYQCPADLDFTVTQAVIVSGASWNPCGHMILCCGSNSDNARYFHVAGQGTEEYWGVYAYPKFMNEAGYWRYLNENGKQELRRRDASISSVTGAYGKLMDYMANKWVWGVLIHNCAVFVRDIILAGGGDLTVMLNCPDWEVANKDPNFSSDSPPPTDAGAPGGV
jgi:hypothetical protein